MSASPQPAVTAREPRTGGRPCPARPPDHPPTAPHRARPPGRTRPLPPARPPGPRRLRRAVVRAPAADPTGWSSWRPRLLAAGLASACGSSDEPAAARCARAPPPPSGSATSRTSPTPSPLVGRRPGLLTAGASATPSWRPRPSTPARPRSRRCSSGAIDAAYIGPNPAINAYAKTNGEAHPDHRRRRLRRRRSSSSSPGSTSAADLKGKTLATPQLGNTQDVALRDLADGATG